MFLVSRHKLICADIKYMPQTQISITMNKSLTSMLKIGIVVFTAIFFTWIIYLPNAMMRDLSIA